MATFTYNPHRLGADVMMRDLVAHINVTMGLAIVLHPLRSYDIERTLREVRATVNAAVPGTIPEFNPVRIKDLEATLIDLGKINYPEA